MKECIRCNKILDIKKFHKTGNGRRRAICSECRSNTRPVLGRMLDGARDRARRKCIPFDLDADFINSLNKKQKGLCAITGVPLNWVPGGGKSIQRSCPMNRVSLDKIDSNGGYTKDNVQLVTDFANRIKYLYSQEELINFCKKVNSQFKVMARTVEH